MGLDILTPRGQQTLKDEDTAVGIWELANPGYRYCRTPKDSASAVDGVIIDRKGLIHGVVETKCRYDLSEEMFRDTFKGEWLVTMDKLTRGADAARMLCVPYYGFLYLVDSRTLLTRKIADSTGQFCVRLRCDNTQTRKTVNGGEIVRANAYIDMSECRTYHAPRTSISTCSPSSSLTKKMTSTAIDSPVKQSAEADAHGRIRSVSDVGRDRGAPR